jgi:hypothetical protein
MEPLIMI